MMYFDGDTSDIMIYVKRIFLHQVRQNNNIYMYIYIYIYMQTFQKINWLV